MRELERRLGDLDPADAIKRLRDWMDDIDRQALDVDSDVGTSTWAVWAPPFRVQFDVAAEAGEVHKAHRDAIKMRMVLYVCDHPSVVHQLQTAFCRAGQELTHWLGT